MQKRSQERDHARDAAAKASQLLKSFVQLEDAEKTLQSLKEQEEAITKQQELAVRVEDAWEVQAVYQRLLDCKKMLEKLRSDLQEQTEQIPNLTEDTKLCIQNTKDAKHQQEEEVAAFTKVAEKVRKAIEVFEKMEAAKMDVIQKEKAVQNADEKERALKAKKEQLEKQQEAWRERSQQLAQSEKNLALWQAKQKDFGLLETEFSRAEQTEKEYKTQKQTTEKRRLAYRAASLEFEEKNAVYEQKRKIFLNAQAGFLAQELKEGCPCPVCGSTEHPSPCKLEKEHQNLTKEMIEELALQAEQLRGKQEQAAAAAEAAGSLLEEKQKNAGESFEHLRSRAKEVLTTELGRDPSLLELSAMTELGTEEIVMALDANRGVESIYQPVCGSDGDELLLIDQIGDQSDVYEEPEKEAVLNKMVIRQLMDTLDETEQQIIRLRYFENKTQCEVAGILAVTQVQISRNERKILAKLRAKLEL